MGTDVHVIVVGGSLSMLDAARASSERLEGLWSRFRDDSEISRLNQLAGLALGVSPETVALVQRSIDGGRITRGAFDPTVLGDVVRAGYDRTFDELSETSGGGRSDLHLGWDGIEVDPAASTVRLPRGVGFDPGGVGKGFAADLVVAELLSLGATGACANLGGDLRVAGDAPAAGAWSIAVQHPYRDEPAAIVGLGSGAVATSMRTRRTWGPAGDLRHHLIDPATGLPARTGIASATVIAAEGWQAEVLSKAAFLSGAIDGLALVESLGADGLVVDDRGDVHLTSGFWRFTGQGDPTASSTLSSSPFTDHFRGPARARIRRRTPMSAQIVWYAARAAGIVAWALAASSVIWGLALSTRALGRRPRPAWLFDFHRFLGGAALIFTGIHVGAILLDTYVHFSLINVLVPFTSTWRPAAVAWGIASFYLILAVELTSLARRYISKKVWRRVHVASFVLFVTSSVHALTAGTDASLAPFRLAVVVACGVVGVLTAIRVGRSLYPKAQPRQVAVALH